MRKLLPLLAVTAMVVAVAAAAVAFVPGMLNALSPSADASTSIAAPTWKAGDSWTYNVSFGSIDERGILPQEMTTGTIMPIDAFVHGTLTETVVGSVSTDYGSAWNVSEDLALSFGEPGPVAGTQPVLQPMAVQPVSVSGFAWVRQSDLALIYTLKSVHMSASWTFNTSVSYPWAQPTATNVTYSLAYGATTQVWYHPALTVWQFPLTENTTWQVASNATVKYASNFEVTGPNVTYSSSHAVNFTMPVDFSMHAGLFENVTTPAGTFHALPVAATRGPEVSPMEDRDAGAMMNLTSDFDDVMVHGFASGWFSGQVGNLVRADLGFGGFAVPRIELDLVSYTYS